MSININNKTDIAKYRKLIADLQLICNYIEEGSSNLDSAKSNLLKIYSINDTSGGDESLINTYKSIVDIKVYLTSTVIPEIEQEISRLTSNPI
jgi:hypothetical protein